MAICSSCFLVFTLRFRITTVLVDSVSVCQTNIMMKSDARPDRTDEDGCGGCSGIQGPPLPYDCLILGMQKPFPCPHRMRNVGRRWLLKIWRFSLSKYYFSDKTDLEPPAFSLQPQTDRFSRTSTLHLKLRKSARRCNRPAC